MSTSPGFYSKENDLSIRISTSDIIKSLQNSSGGGNTSVNSGSGSGGTVPLVPSIITYWILAYSTWGDSYTWLDHANWID